MTHEGSRTVPAGRPGSGLFVSGIVLGVALGILAGHLLLFFRGGSEESATTADEEFAQLVASSPTFAALDSSRPPEDTSNSILEFDGREDVGHVRLSDRSSDDEHLHFFPEAMDSRGTSDVTHADRPLTAHLESTGSLQMTADASRSGESPPQALLPPAAAAPIDKATSDREALARSLIKEELPDATDQEREVWYDVLQGLPGEDIKGILRMRKHIGSQGAVGLFPPGASLAAQPGLPAQPVSIGPLSPTTAEESAVIRRLRQIAGRNLANRHTVAFKQHMPVLVEASADNPAAIDLTRMIRDMRQGELTASDRTLDVALSGPGFLQVRCGDQVRYTRDGRLSLDAQGRLMLLAPTEVWLLDPPIAIPQGATDINITPDGAVSAILPAQQHSTLGQLRIVRFLNPSALHSPQEGLYETTPEAGSPYEALPSDSPSTQVLQRHLEQSNVVTMTTPGGPVDDSAGPRR